MNRHDALERELTAWFRETAMPRTPDYTTDIVQLTATVRQRPRWAFPERWLPVTIITLGRRTAPPFPWRTVGLIALLALLVAGIAVYIGSRERLPAPFGPAANGLVAYARDGDIITVDPTNGARHWITSGDESDREPRWSLDGTRLAFLREAPVPVPNKPDAWLQSVVIVDRGWKVVAKSSGIGAIDDDAMAWSPDGRWIALAGDDTYGLRNIYLVDTADGQVERFQVNYSGLDFYWRPGYAAQLLFQGGTRDGHGLVVADVEDPAAAELIVEAGDGPRPNGWTPDGHRIVYTVWTADGAQLHVLDIGTGDDVVIDAGFGHVSNDGQRILAVDTSGRPCVAPIDGGQCIAIGPIGRTYDGTHAGGAQWAPDDAWIVTVRLDDPGSASLLDPKGVVDAQPAWIADGAESWQRLAP